MRFVVLGSGAVGGVVGARLHLAGLPVSLVARGEHLAAIRARGLVVDRADGRRTVPVPVTADLAAVGWDESTVVLLCVKSHQTAAALDDLVRHAPAGTPVVCVQNGVANEPVVLRHFASTYAVCVMLPSLHLEPGTVVEKCGPVPGLLDLGRFPTGPADGTDATAEAVAADLRAAGFDSVVRGDVMAWKHRKLVVNIVGDARALLGAGPEGDALAERVGEEAEAVLVAAGRRAISPAEDRARRGDLLRVRADVASYAGNSLRQSLQRGLPSEIDYRSGEVVLLGRLHGIATPANEELVAEVARRTARTTDADGPATSR